LQGLRTNILQDTDAPPPRMVSSLRVYVPVFLGPFSREIVPVGILRLA